MFADYYAWNTQAMLLDSHAHSPSHNPSSVENTGGMTGEAAQERAADESIPASVEGEYVSVMTFPLNEYTEKEILFFTGQLVDAKHPLSDIEQQNWNQLLRLFPSRVYNYACG